MASCPRPLHTSTTSFFRSFRLAFSSTFSFFSFKSWQRREAVTQHHGSPRPLAPHLPPAAVLPPCQGKDVKKAATWRSQVPPVGITKGRRLEVVGQVAKKGEQGAGAAGSHSLEAAGTSPGPPQSLHLPALAPGPTPSRQGPPSSAFCLPPFPESCLPGSPPRLP